MAMFTIRGPDRSVMLGDEVGKIAWSAIAFPCLTTVHLVEGDFFPDVSTKHAKPAMRRPDIPKGCPCGMSPSYALTPASVS